MQSKKTLIFLMLVLIISACNKKDKNERVKFFPKIELKAKNIPCRKNLWVLILAGQSNMAGRGFVEPQDTIPNERIFTMNKNGDIIIAKEPLHFYEKTMTGLDCGLSFGKALIKHIPDSVSVLLIPTAVGGSTISQWLGDSTHRNVKLLTNLKEKVKIGKNYGQIKGILWLQGESDANKENVLKYKLRLSKLIEKFRFITEDKETLVLIGELGSYSNNPFWTKINEQIEAYSLTDFNVATINTSDLSERGDKLHFNSESQRILGKRFAKELLKRQE